MEIWLGHVVNLFQLNPECLSILSMAYRFVKSGVASGPIWPGLRQEMRAVMGVLFLLEIDLGARYGEEVFCGDSSSEGFAVHVTKASPEELREAWRWREKWRYRRVFAVPELPSVVDPESVYVLGGHPRAGLGSATGFGRALLRRSRFSVATNLKRLDEGEEVLVPGSVPPLDTRWTARSRYRLVARGRWAWAGEHINMKEGRVALASLRRHCRSVKGAGRHVLTLSDNLACVGAFEKGRSSSPLLTLCRRACGYRLVCEVQ